ncbi:ribonuclease HI [Clostridium acetobutylicum]|uniref:Ribonuclease H n=1 Tax=Clostridium acetobutylicum (strain ATCC 824 / DSM 792 / JCM 1419 / IAM 19013 / LMG 5710 / NBRC 13948 / NRRL B-527 / VKM B-1787 / 2291 / W) TaxID=272562 RepID=Q97G21_CLOAB|nr:MULTISPECIES: viroplasmin family protein [Clostridium]AAK80502.1 RNAse H family protein [Clostridium acetobutylicum ATCC 824]ADZ21601.1 RNAse H family protein [Clostridium acetobutylicum EA 2018]AEI32425.1 RNAse H family protein [Clostridium acetobutylicum DSM 1731]AWV79080.1 RNase H [Clostridium acetobutylicum]MBC2394958.1 reverse transcriptase-like protein [Clostridium acetobutylicum]
MAKKNFYAVKEGRKTGIFKTWDECVQYVSGYPNAKYKGFVTREEAEVYLEGCVNLDINNEEPVPKFNQNIPLKSGYDITPIKSKAKVKSSKTFVEPDTIKEEYEFIAFVDGSYDKLKKLYGSGVIVLGENDEFKVYSTAGRDTWDQWNIVGELEATKLALTKAKEFGTKNVAIYHDLKNIALWATGEWKAKNEFTQGYVKFIEDISKELNIYFVKVKGHSYESKYNDLADEAAKKAIVEY